MHTDALGSVGNLRHFQVCHVEIRPEYSELLNIFGPDHPTLALGPTLQYVLATHTPLSAAAAPLLQRFDIFARTVQASAYVPM